MQVTLFDIWFPRFGSVDKKVGHIVGCWPRIRCRRVAKDHRHALHVNTAITLR